MRRAPRDQSLADSSSHPDERSLDEEMQNDRETHRHSDKRCPLKKSRSRAQNLEAEPHAWHVHEVYRIGVSSDAGRYSADRTPHWLPDVRQRESYCETGKHAEQVEGQA